MLEAGGYRVLGEAASAAGTVGEAARWQPAVLLLDIGLPDGSGLDSVGPIRDVSPATIVVLISSRRASDYGERLADSGADGFLDKTALTASSLGALLVSMTAR